MNLAHLLPILIEELGHLIRSLAEARARHLHAHGVQSAIDRLTEAQNALVRVSRQDAHAHHHLARATDSLIIAQGALVAQMSLGGQSIEHLAQAIERLASVLERLGDLTYGPRVVDAAPHHPNTHQASRKVAD